MNGGNGELCHPNATFELIPPDLFLFFLLFFLQYPRRRPLSFLARTLVGTISWQTPLFHTKMCLLAESLDGRLLTLTLDT